MKATRSGRTLSNGNASVIKSMISRGDRQHDIASYFGVNGGRVGEISKGRTFLSVPAHAGTLPPSAPYLVIDADFRKKIAALKVDLSGKGVSSKDLMILDDLIVAMDASHAARDGV